MQLGDDGVFRSDLLQQFSWLWHGFGTRLSGAWPGEYTKLKQIHSDLIHRADTPGGVLGEGDGLVTVSPSVPVGIRTADCVPILLADAGTRCVAAIHAGWRGTVQQIVVRAVERMQQDFGADPKQIYAAIGPCISECCFEVGPEVAVHFQAEGRTRVNLVEANLQQLTKLRIPREQIDIAGVCTMCDAERLHSYRRDKDASGRMVAAIGIHES